MGIFRGFTKDDIEFFKNMPPKDQEEYSKKQKEYYNKYKDQAKHIDEEFIALFKDIDIFLKIKFNSKYKWDAKRLSQGFGREFDSIWGAFHTDKRKRQEDIQLFMNLGLFPEDTTPTFNAGMSLRNFVEDDLYENYRTNLKSSSDKIRNILENSKNKYDFEDDEEKVINGNTQDAFSQWIELPGSIWISFDESIILDTTNFVEKIKSIMLELYQIFDLLIKNEDSK